MSPRFIQRTISTKRWSPAWIFPFANRNVKRSLSTAHPIEMAFLPFDVTIFASLSPLSPAVQENWPLETYLVPAVLVTTAVKSSISIRTCPHELPAPMPSIRSMINRILCFNLLIILCVFNLVLVNCVLPFRDII